MFDLRLKSRLMSWPIHHPEFKSITVFKKMPGQIGDTIAPIRQMVSLDAVR